MSKNGDALRYDVENTGSLRDCVNDVLARMDNTGEEQAFRVRLVLNELLVSALECGRGRQHLRMRVQCLCDCVKIDIDDAGYYAKQLVRLDDHILVCGSAFEENRYRLMLVREMADELVFNVKNGRLTAVVSTV